ncbi:MAG: TRAP transporter large permease subunit [Pseudomonadota bacterium]
MGRAATVLETTAGAIAALALFGIVAALLVNVVARSLGLALVGANTFALWIFAILALAALPSLTAQRVPVKGASGLACQAILGFVLATMGLGAVAAAERLGGTDAVLGLPVAWRYVAAALLCGLAVLTQFARCGPGLSGLAFGLGAAAAFLPLPPLPLAVAAGGLALALFVKVPVALALVFAVVLAPGPMAGAALSQTLMRGLSTYVLLAVPLFVFAAALLVAGGLGAKIVEAARALTGRRNTAMGEANVLASALFGGVSGSSIADAAMGARLLVPPMVAAGYTPSRAAALTASSAILPNLLPPSIALLLAAAATDQSVAALWLAGVGAGAVVLVALWLAVRLLPPEGKAAPSAKPSARALIGGLVPPVLMAAVILTGLRIGLVTAVEAGLFAVALGVLYAVLGNGWRAALTALSEAALQTGRVAVLIAAAAPVGFILATSGIDWSAALPGGNPLVATLAAVALALIVGTILDVGAGILVLLPFLLPAGVAAGADPIAFTLAVVVALLIGGLTPPVGMLILVVKDVTGADGAFRAVVPFLLALVAAAALIAAGPPLLAMNV